MEGTRRDEAEVVDLAETEGARRASGVSATGGAALDPEVPAKAKRRQFSAEYRLRVLREADGCKVPGDVGALLRREGLYSSHLVLWRRQREASTPSASFEESPGPRCFTPWASRTALSLTCPTAQCRRRDSMSAGGAREAAK
jgi:transposase-like protein